MDNGWIKLHRKTTEKGYYKKSQYVHLWIHLLLTANHKPKEFMWNKEIIHIKEGQILTGRKELATYTGISESTVENILRFLESEHQIEQQKTTKFRLITIINWKKYQQKKPPKQQNEQQMNNKVTTDEQQMDTNKNIKNDKKEKNDKKKELSPDSDFILQLLNSFKTNYLIIKGTDYKGVTGPDRKAIGGLLKYYNQKNPNSDRTKILQDFDKVFKHVLNHNFNNDYLNTVTLTKLNSKWDEYRSLLKNGTSNQTNRNNKGFDINTARAWLNSNK